MTQKHLRVLLVDDEKSLREPLTKYLEMNFGFEVCGAENSEEALQLLDAYHGQFDVALIDDLLFTPPEGIDLMRQIKAKYPEIESIIFTGWGNDHRQRALKEGAFRYLEKPFDNLELATLIRTAAQQVRLRAISREILLQRKLELVFAQITEATKSLVAADGSMIVRLDAITERLAVYPQQLEMEQQGKQIINAIESMSREIIANGNVVVVSETENQKDDFAQLYAVGYRSFIGIPIIGEQGSLGALFAYSRTSGQFDAGETVAVLRTFAGQAGLAIANAYAFQQVKSHNEHMDALIKVGQKLTQTTHQDEQLDIAWDYVHQQLGVTTFLVALYDERSDRLSFPLVYDNNVAQSLDAITLGNEKTEWGITGHVVKTGNEIFWPTSDIEQEVCEALGIVSKRFGDPCCSCFYFPLTLGNQVVGAISVQSYDPYAFPPVTLDVCRALGNQLVVALENARLVTEARNWASDLETLQRLSTDLASSLSLDEVMTRTCKAAVALFTVDHSGLVLFDADNAYGTVAAEYPEATGTLKTRIPLSDVPGEQQLVANHDPVIVENVADAQEYLGPVRRILYEQFGIQSILIVPVISKDRLLGSFSLDVIEKRRNFTQKEIELSKIFAAQVAVAIDNAQLYAETSRRGQLLSSLEAASRHIRAEKEPARLMSEVTRLAAELMDCDAGCLFDNDIYRKECRIAETYKLPDEIKGQVVRNGQDLISRVAARSVTAIWPCEESDISLAPPLDRYGFKQAIALPLKQNDQVMGVLLLAYRKDTVVFTSADQEILQRYAIQASIALQTSRSMTREQRRASQITTLHRMGSYLQSTNDIDRSLHILATGVTASYGLGLNRVGILFENGSNTEFVGRMGIGYYEESEWRQAVTSDGSIGQDSLDHYIERLERGELTPTPLQNVISALRISKNEDALNVFSSVTHDLRNAIVQESESNRLPKEFVTAFQPSFPLVVAPLVARGRAIGVLVADNKFTHSPITNPLTESLMTFINTAAIAIDNMRLVVEAQRREDQLRTYYEASNALVLTNDVGRVLNEIVEKARVAADASCVGMILMKKSGKILRMIVAGAEHPADSSALVRPDGYSMQVMTTGVPAKIEDTLQAVDTINPSRFWQGIRSALCMPLTIEGERQGVVWFYYGQQRTFSESEVHAVKLYVNHAALAHDTVRRIEELQQMRIAAEAMAQALEPAEALQEIVKLAARVLKADSVALWSFDDVRDKFIPHELTAYGIPDDVLESIRNAEPKPGHTTETVMRESYLAVTDVLQPNVDYLGQPTRDLLARIDVRSFQAVLLSVGEERLGVLYANYRDNTVFGDEDKNTLLTFASHAAQALKTARLLAQLQRTRRAAGVVAGAVVQQELKETLTRIARETRDVLDADVVSIYAYDEEAKQFTAHGADITEQRQKDSILAPTQLSPGSTVAHRVISLDTEPYLLTVDDNAIDNPTLSGSFVRREDIRAASAIQLRAGNNKVGVMFVSFRAAHRFRSDEVATVQLFADQAAVAIRNRQLYAQTAFLLDQARHVSEIGQEVAANLDTDAFLESLFSRLVAIFGERQIPIYPSLATYDASHKTLNTFRTKFYPAGTRPDTIAITRTPGIMALVARSKKVYYSPDVSIDPNYNQLVENTRSEVAFPVIYDGGLLAVLDLESPMPNAFSDQDRQFLRTLAHQIAATIHNVQQYKDLRETQGLIGRRTAVAWVGMVAAEWGHRVVGNAVTIRDTVELLESDLSSTLTADATEKLDRIKRKVQDILDNQVSAPLHAAQGIEIVSLARLLEDRLYQLKQRPLCALLSTEFQDSAFSATVRANPEWLKRVLDLLVDNAVRAMTNSRDKRLTITVCDAPASEVGQPLTARNVVKVQVQDTGTGIPEKIRRDLFSKPVSGTKGSGVGLLLAQLIIQTYGGDIYVDDTGADGTTMVFWLPKE